MLLSPLFALLVASLVQELPTASTVETLITNESIGSKGRLGGVAIDGNGVIYVSNFDTHVWRVTGAGQVTVLAANLRGSSGNAILGEDLLQASFSENKILRIQPDGTQSIFADTNLAGPVGIVVAETGEVFVCNCQSNSITRVAVDGTTSIFAQGAEFNCPNGITVGPDGAIYVVNFQAPHILRISRAGEEGEKGEVERFATIPGAGNAHIAWAAGAFFVTHIKENKLYRVSPEREVLLFAGTGESGLDDGPLRSATLNAPNGIATAPDGLTLVMNNLRGVRHSGRPSELVLRIVELEPAELSSSTAAAPADSQAE